MLKNYLRIALRTITKQRTRSSILILSLCLGFSVAVFAAFYLSQELSFDGYYASAQSTYRVTQRSVDPQKNVYQTQTPALLAEELRLTFPEITRTCRVYFSYRNLISVDNTKTYQKEIIFADPDFFSFFDTEPIAGNPQTMLSAKNSVVLTHSMATNYFGDTNPIGKSLLLDAAHPLTVTGVVPDQPVNTHMQYTMVVTYATLHDTPQADYIPQWGCTFGSYTYVQTSTPHIAPLEQAISAHMKERLNWATGTEHLFQLQPIRAIHLDAEANESLSSGSRTNCIVIAAIAAFILLLACINFINITTAGALQRSREIGVRKVFGAARQQLIRQFLMESVVLAFIALFISLGVVELTKESVEGLIGGSLHLHLWSEPLLVVGLVILTLITGLAAGFYPALVLSRFHPVGILHSTGSITTGGKTRGAILRKTLVLVQFTISIVLILATLIIHNQMRFMHNYNMGFRKDQIVVLRAPGYLSGKWNAIKEECTAIPGVAGCSVSLGAPVFNSGFGCSAYPPGGDESTSFFASVKMVDQEFQELYQLQTIAGKSIGEFEAAQKQNAAIINETMVAKLGYLSAEEALGKTLPISLNGFEPEIIGVLKDYRYQSLRSSIDPVIFLYWPTIAKEVNILLNPTNISTTLGQLEAVWKTHWPDHPFSYDFLDEKVAGLYLKEEHSYTLISLCSTLALLIASLGLLGLTIHTTQQRTKEIGIRKVLGSSVGNIVLLLSGEFTRWILLANLLAWPTAWWLMQKWQQSYQVKAPMHLGTFLLAGGMSLLLALITISALTLRAATANPINALKDE